MDPTLLAQSLVFALDLTVTLLLWLNYRHLRLTYLALATLAGTLEIARQIVDTLIILNVDLVALWHLTSVLQFSSSLVFLGALLRVQRDARRLTWLTVPLTLMFVGIYGAQQLTGFESTTREWYVFYVPLLLTQTLIVWRGSVLGPRWPLSRVVLLVTGMALLVIRSWLPVYMHVVYDQLFYTLYYLETLICPMMLGALVLSALEHTHRRVQSLLADRIQAGTDLQFILDHSLDVIVTTDEAGTIQSWSLRGEQEFGYAHDQAVGRLTIHDLLVDHPTEGTWDVSAEFETPVRRAHGPDGLVKVRVQTVERDSRSYRIYVLQDVSAQAEIRKQRAVLDRQLQHAVKLEGLGVLAGGIAHDFNNILTSLFGNISLAKMELATHHRAWSYLTDAESWRHTIERGAI